MKILAFSDPHLGRHSKFGKNFGKKLFDKVKRVAETEKPDVVICCGDLAEPDECTLTDGMKLFEAIPCKHKLLVAGNNDIEQVSRMKDRKFVDYVEVIGRLAEQHGIRLLDSRPFVLGDYAFVGNFGFYDLSLWRAPDNPDPKLPQTMSQLKSACLDWHIEHFGLSHTEIFNMCLKRLYNHLKMVAGKRIVLCTHTVPTRNMVLYGHSAKYDLQNAWMGFNDSELESPLADTPGLLTWLCGHTHRNHRTEGKVPMINVSGIEQPFIFEVN